MKRSNSGIERELTPAGYRRVAIAQRFLALLTPIRTLSYYATGLASIIENCSGALMRPAAVELAARQLGLRVVGQGDSARIGVHSGDVGLAVAVLYPRALALGHDVPKSYWYVARHQAELDRFTQRHHRELAELLDLVGEPTQ